MEMPSQFDRLGFTSERIVDFFRQRYRFHLPPPTVREVAEAVGLSSSSTVYNHLRSLERRRRLAPRVFGRSRATELSKDEKLQVSLAEFAAYWSTHDRRFGPVAEHLARKTWLAARGLDDTETRTTT